MILSVRVFWSLLASSVDVAVTVKTKSTSLSAGGVTERLVNVQLVTSTDVLPLVAVNEFVPSVRVAPTGTALISNNRLSLPSVSFNAELIVKPALCVSSSTLTVAGTVSDG